MFDAELKPYLQQAYKALPCRQAREAFARYTQDFVCDIAENEPDADFAAVRERLPEPTQSARDFCESQAPQTQAEWQRRAERGRRGKIAAVAAVLAVLVGIVAFYIKTRGVIVINTVTYYTDYGDTDLTLEEMTEIAEERFYKRHPELEDTQNENR